MRDTVETSLLLQHRAKEVVPKRNIKKWKKLLGIVILLLLHRIISLVEKWNRSEGTPQVAYTFDAGPNAVMIARDRKNCYSLLLQKLLTSYLSSKF
ncbi:hypothetical protein M0R45_035903 [Rubus argutus]|uniref:Mvd1 C-terminal domain-containing protein n=1 Tax=Rubus argutus TaxID=59490 RepID=A0AAW1VX36_RUBAR